MHTYRRSVFIFFMAENKSKEERTNQIIDAAVFEFIEKGYEGTSMESVAKRAKLSKGGLYHHFKSKDEIMIAANNRFTEPIQMLVEICKQNNSPTEGLKKYISEYLAYWHAHPAELQFTFLSIFKIMSYKEMWADMNSYLKYFTDFFSEMLQKAIDCNELKQHNTESKALAMASSLDGITTYLMMYEDSSMIEIAKQLIETFIGELEINKHD